MRDELERRANLHGSKTAIAMADGSGSYSFSELDERANAICEIIRSAGLHEGEAIGLLTENDIQTVAWWWGGRRAGVYFVPIDVRARPDVFHESLNVDIAHAVVRCTSRAVFGS
jgi:pyochelin synthetase